MCWWSEQKYIFTWFKSIRSLVLCNLLHSLWVFVIKTVKTKFWSPNGLSHDVIDWGGSEKFHNVVNVIHTGRGWESEWSKMEMFPATKFWGNSWLAGKECLHACNIISFFLSPFFLPNVVLVAHFCPQVSFSFSRFENAQKQNFLRNNFLFPEF